jgi:hypothetical protein
LSERGTYRLNGPTFSLEGRSLDAGIPSEDNRPAIVAVKNSLVPAGNGDGV